MAAGSTTGTFVCCWVVIWGGAVLTPVVGFVCVGRSGGGSVVCGGAWIGVGVGVSPAVFDNKGVEGIIVPVLVNTVGWWVGLCAICGLRRSAGRSNAVSFPQGTHT
jgi:hypothetical protein